MKAPAFFGDFHAVAQGFGDVAEEIVHFFARFEMVMAVDFFARVRAVEQGQRTDAAEHLTTPVIFRIDVMDIGRGDHRQAGFMRQTQEPAAQGDVIFPIVEQFNIEPAREHPGVIPRRAHRPAVAIPRQEPRHVPVAAPAQGDHPLRPGLQLCEGDGLVILGFPRQKPAEVRVTGVVLRQQHQVRAILQGDLTPNHRGNAGLVTAQIKIDDATEHMFISQRHRGTTGLFGGGDEIRQRRCGFVKRKIGMTMKRNEIEHHERQCKVYMNTTLTNDCFQAFSSTPKNMAEFSRDHIPFPSLFKSDPCYNLGVMGLFSGLQRMVINKALEQHKTLVCPECRKEFPSPPPDSLEGFQTKFGCPHCGHQMTLMELNSPDGNQGELRESAIEVQDQPRGSAIKRDVLAGGLVGYQLPRKFGAMWFFVLFGGFWLGLSGTLFVGGLYQWLEDRTMENLLPVLFVSVFVIIGLVILWMGVLQGLRRDTLLLSPQSIGLDRRYLGMGKVRQIPVAEIITVEAKEFYQQNYQPVYGIEIRGKRRKLRFGSSLEEEDRRWLLWEIRRYIGLSS